MKHAHAVVFKLHAYFILTVSSVHHIYVDLHSLMQIWVKWDVKLGNILHKCEYHRAKFEFTFISVERARVWIATISDLWDNLDKAPILNKCNNFQMEWKCWVSWISVTWNETRLKSRLVNWNAFNTNLPFQMKCEISWVKWTHFKWIVPTLRKTHLYNVCLSQLQFSSKWNVR